MHWKKVMVTTIYKIDRKKDYKKTIYSWCPELCPTDHINFVSESVVSDAAKMPQVSQAHVSGVSEVSGVTRSRGVFIIYD